MRFFLPTPRSLYSRFLLIMVIPMVLLQAVATYIFYERHWDSVSRNTSASLTGEIAILVRTVLDGEEKPENQALLTQFHDQLSLSYAFVEDGASYAQQTSRRTKFSYFEEALQEEFADAEAIYISDRTNGSEVTIALVLSEGVLEITAPRKRLANPTTYIFVMWMVGTGAVLLLIAMLFLRNQIRAITRLAKAAERFGKGEEITFKPQGAMEVRQAGRAFIDMRERIKRQIRQRTEMLAGVSHDLRTPLTRMKLQLKLLPASPETEALQHDIDDMETMVEGYLDFARGGGKAHTEITSLPQLLHKVVDGYSEDQERIALVVSEDITLPLRRQAFRRCVTNLINNALTYAKHITIHSEVCDNHVHLFLDDDGPGIPEENRENVFMPFFRLEGSRNPNTGGVGLGLSIAQDIVLQHGGEIRLGESPKQGLRVHITLPL